MVETEQTVIRDTMITNQMLANILSNHKKLAQIITKINAAPDKISVVVEVALLLLEAVKLQFKGNMTPALLFATGTFALTQLNIVLKVNKVEPLGDKEMQLATGQMIKDYLEQHKTDSDIGAIGAALKDMQASMIDGRFAKQFSKTTGAPISTVSQGVKQAVSMQQQKLQQPKAVL